MKRTFTRFIGIDLGGGRGKTTAIAEIRSGAAGAEVFEVATRATAREPWTDDTLTARLAVPQPDTVIAVDAPLTQAACNRCERPVCPGMEACAEPAVVWLRTVGRNLVRKVGAETVNGSTLAPPALTAQARLAPYAHRATDVVMTYERGLLPLAQLGASNGAIAARAGYLRRRLRTAGYVLHDNLIEVSPAATIAALCGLRASRGYKRDADPWRTRADPRATRRPPLRAAEPDGARGRAAERPLFRCRDRRVHRVPLGDRRLDHAGRLLRRGRLDRRAARPGATLASRTRP
ncbi:MAG: hypothetical protein WKG01_28415 [Kofleriaceae bacterium]